MFSSLARLPTLWRVLPWGASVVLGLLCWHFDARAVADAMAIKTQAAQFKAAQANAEQSMQLALQQAQATYRNEADHAQQSYQSQLASTRAAADAYVAAHRLRAQAAASGRSAPAGASKTADAGVPENVSAGAVMVSADDVQACTAVTAYALQARDWAMTMAK